ncbi:MAG: M56 family metallopeptidase [Janthinobacterium lividum]
MHSLPQLVSSLIFQPVSPLVSARLAVLASLLVSSVWQGVLLTAVVAFSLRLLPELSAAARSTLWTAVLLVVIAMPFLPLAVASSSRPSGEGLWHVEEAISFGIVLLWATVSLTRIMHFAADLLRLRGIVRRATPMAMPTEVAGVLPGDSRRVLLCSSEDVDRPSVAGFFRPRILLPPALLAQLSEAELMQVVLHEAEHLRRYDDWVNLLQQLSLALFPLNPALFWLNRRLSLERELACDDGVLRSTGARKAYAACLARVAEHSLVRRGVALALGVLGDWFGQAQRKPELAHRVERILHAPAPTMNRGPMRFATGGVLAGVLGAASLLAHSPVLVSFTPDPGTMAAATAPFSPGRPMARPVGHTDSDRPVMMQAVMHLPASNSSVPLQQFAFRAQPVRLRASVPRRVKATPQRNTARALHAAQEIAAPQQRSVQQSAVWRVTTWQSAGITQRNAEAAVQVSGDGNSALAVGSPQPVAPAFRPSPVLFHNAGAWYTAVPVQGGWLIVQL